MTKNRFGREVNARSDLGLCQSTPGEEIRATDAADANLSDGGVLITRMLCAVPGEEGEGANKEEM